MHSVKPVSNRLNVAVELNIVETMPVMEHVLSVRIFDLNFLQGCVNPGTANHFYRQGAGTVLCAKADFII